jgi:hypothetical protein
VGRTVLERAVRESSTHGTAAFDESDRYLFAGVSSVVMLLPRAFKTDFFVLLL